MDKESPISALARALNQASEVYHSTVELAKAQASKGAAKLALSLGLLGAGLVVALGVLPLLLLALVWGLVAAGLPAWGAYLIVAGVAVLLAAIMVLIGVRLIKRASVHLGKGAAVVKGSVSAVLGAPQPPE
jgi:hypothetical protein